MSIAGDFDRGVERILERREEARYEGGVDGSFALSGQGRSGGVLVFACRIDSISAKAMVLTAPASGAVGEQIWVDVNGFGIVRGEIERLLDEGFILKVIGSGDFRRKLGAWVALMRRRGGRVTADKRVHMRAQPRDARTMVRLPGGALVRGLVGNVSRSGAAISADCVVEPGDEVIIGLVPSRVVRLLEVGFAVAFDDVLEAAAVDRLVTGFRDAPILDRDAV